MRTFLFFILVAVCAVLLWAIWSHSYVNTTIFSLGLLATGLCGYLISDYFFNIEKKTGQSDLTLYKKEVGALKEELDILRKQSALATPQTEVEDLKSRFYLLEEEKNKINGDFLAQAATISQLNTRLEALQKEYNKLKEDSTITTESRSTELDAIRDTLATSKTKLNELVVENESLKMELNDYKEVVTSRKIEENEIESLRIQLSEYKNTPESRSIEAAEIENLKTEIAQYKALAETSAAQSTEIEALKAEIAQYKANLEIHEKQIAEREVLKKEAASVPTTPEKDSYLIMPTTPKMTGTKKESETKIETKVISINDNNDRLELQPVRKKTVINEENSKAKSAEVIASPSSDSQMVDNQDINSESQNKLNTEGLNGKPRGVQQPHPIYGSSDDLKVIEGIGPKIESILKAAGIDNWHDLAEASVTNLKGVLEQAGSRYRLNDPSTWPEQARLLAGSEWDKFKIYTDYLIGGKTPKV
jgi:predicted flap endonuclease-1-like 5' DNA nuclease